MLVSQNAQKNLAFMIGKHANMLYTHSMSKHSTLSFRLAGTYQRRFVATCETYGITPSEGARWAIQRFVETAEQDIRLDFHNDILRVLGETRAKQLTGWLTVFTSSFIDSFESWAQAVKFLQMPRAIKTQAIISALDDFLALPDEERHHLLKKFEDDTGFELDRESLAKPPQVSDAKK